MSWDVVESWDAQSTGVSVEENGVKGTSDVTRTFSVLADVTGRTTLEALAAPGVPRANDAHPQQFGLRARTFDCQQVSPLEFRVTVGYVMPSADPNDPTQNPLDQPASVTFGAITQDVEIDEDVNGDPIQTVNGEPIAGVTRPFTDLSITVRRNLPTFDPLSISTYMNKVNSATWYGLPAGTVRIMDIAASNVFSNDLEYWDVSITFQVRRGAGPVTDAKAWWYRTAHQGYKVWDGSALVNATESDGTTVAQPVMIQTVADDGVSVGQGAQVAAGVGRYIEFQVLETVDFNTLNLL